MSEVTHKVTPAFFLPQIPLSHFFPLRSNCTKLHQSLSSPRLESRTETPFSGLTDRKDHSLPGGIRLFFWLLLRTALIRHTGVLCAMRGGGILSTGDARGACIGGCGGSIKILLLASEKGNEKRCCCCCYSNCRRSNVLVDVCWRLLLSDNTTPH